MGEPASDGSEYASLTPKALTWPKAALSVSAALKLPIIQPATSAFRWARALGKLAPLYTGAIT